MVVNWKNHESTDRLVASLLAAHPDLKVAFVLFLIRLHCTPSINFQKQLDYHAMALVFGQGATYDSIEGRFRRYRKIADELRDEAHGRGITDIPRYAGRNHASGGSAASTPRTPRGPRGGITKSTPSSSRNRSYRHTQTPTKQKTKPGRSVMDAIYVDDIDTEEESKIKPEIPGDPYDSEDDDVKGVDSPSIKIKKEIRERSMAGLFSPINLKKEEETSVFGSKSVSTHARGIQDHNDGTHYPAGMNEDPLYKIDSYFDGGNMDDIYRGAA
ncbi:hypothetical protein ABOM_005404 [Aspergillus bombycis]|uniref:Uncharacterized protein n=1 Tax=Aspergillus bombycis TaxID=109264 RepID=A0A1F8A310_9EURO|nr:hypothetical protein ABOM_005404 [Aspergillus bombycis]OGM45708.1 hypothetical protein ABOM_005404 [Aspergillus bombycis]